MELVYNGHGELIYECHGDGKATYTEQRLRITKRNIHLTMEIWPEAWGWMTKEFPTMIDRGA